MRHKHHHFPASTQAYTQVEETSNRGEALPSTQMRWIKSPAWDLVWVLNALWLAPLVFLLAQGHDDVRASPVDGLFFALVVPLWFGHRVSSAWLAYATPAYRPLLATQRLRFVVAPLAIAGVCFALLLAPESALPMPLTERVVWFAVLDYLLPAAWPFKRLTAPARTFLVLMAASLCATCIFFVPAGVLWSETRVASAGAAEGE